MHALLLLKCKKMEKEAYFDYFFFTCMILSFLFLFACSSEFEKKRKSAEEGDPEAQYLLGKYYENGSEEIQKDLTEALKWYRKSAEQGNAEAQYNLGMLFYAEVKDIEQDYKKAAKWIKKAAEQGISNAQNTIGEMYYNAQGVKFDDSEAEKWFRLAAEQGNVKALYNIGKIYGERWEKDEASIWYLKAAKGGYSEAYVELGMWAYVNKKYNDAEKFYRNSAELGNPMGQKYLGNLYCDGFGVDKNILKGLKWLKLSAKQGNAFAEFDIGELYYIGNDVEQDYSEAISWFIKAADNNLLKAQLLLGKIYEEGIGVEKDYSNALNWYMMAGKQNSFEALIKIGDFYKNGYGVKTDRKKALKYYDTANLANAILFVFIEKKETIDKYQEGAITYVSSFPGTGQMRQATRDELITYPSEDNDIFVIANVSIETDRVTKFYPYDSVTLVLPDGSMLSPVRVDYSIIGGECCIFNPDSNTDPFIFEAGTRKTIHIRFETKKTLLKNTKVLVAKKHYSIKHQ